MDDFASKIEELMPGGLSTDGLDILQVNIGRQCNLACKHCHLECSPKRTEMMGWELMEEIVAFVGRTALDLVDITGGAPELHPQFREFVRQLRETGQIVQVRSNLVALLEPTLQGTMEFLQSHWVRLVASMPCYLEENVRAQRGPGVYEKSVEAIRRLNGLGYGIDPGLALDLVYNPGGSFLPGEQSDLEAAYREELDKRFGIRFNRLYVITNMPIGRFGTELDVAGLREAYMDELREAFNPSTLDHLMCRRQVCVDWDGKLYDCDFNLALGIEANASDSVGIDRVDGSAIEHRPIATGPHCFGCTAGAGSSCAGALVDGD